MATRIRRDTVLRRLIAARDLISKKRNWTRGRSAANKDGATTSTHSKGAVMFCATGAIRRVTHEDRQRVGSDAHARDMLRRLADALPSDASVYGTPTARIQRFNDKLDVVAFCSDSKTTKKAETSKHRRVVSTFNRAIRTLEAELEG